MNAESIAKANHPRTTETTQRERYSIIKKDRKGTRALFSQYRLKEEDALGIWRQIKSKEPNNDSNALYHMRLDV